MVKPTPRSRDFRRMKEAYQDLLSMRLEINAYTQEMREEPDTRRRNELATALCEAHRRWQRAYATFEGALMRVTSATRAFSSVALRASTRETAGAKPPPRA